MSVLGFKRSVGVGDAVYLGLGLPFSTAICPWEGQDWHVVRFQM